MKFVTIVCLLAMVLVLCLCMFIEFGEMLREVKESNMKITEAMKIK